MKHIIIVVDGVRISMLAASAFSALDQAMDLFPDAGRIVVERSK